MLSFTKATAQPPHPAPVSLAPRAPFWQQILTSSSNSEQLILLTRKKKMSIFFFLKKKKKRKKKKKILYMQYYLFIQQCEGWKTSYNTNREPTRQSQTAKKLCPFFFPSNNKLHSETQYSMLVPAFIQNTTAIMTLIHKVTKLL